LASTTRKEGQKRLSNTRAKKAVAIDGLEKIFKETDMGILTEYRGIKANDVAAMRRKLDPTGIKFKVVKNTLARFAADRTGKSKLNTAFKGPMAVAFGYKDASETAKALTDYLRTAKSPIVVIGGFLGDKLISAEEVKTLAALPPKNILIAQVIGGVQGPIASLIGMLNAPVQEMVGVIEARKNQLEAK